MDRLNFNHLFYFYIVSKEGSIKGASERLHVSQPTISDQIKLLESYLQVSLFERRNRSLILTKEGDMALRYSEEIFDRGRELTARLRHGRAGLRRTLEIGITYSMSHYFLYDWIMPLFDHEDLAINFREGERRYLLADLEEDKLDLLFTDDREGVPNVIDSYSFGVNRTFAVAHKKHKKAQNNFPQSLNDLPYFTYTSASRLKYEIELYFRKNSIRPRVCGEADDVDLHQLVTEKGLAFTVVPEVAKQRFIKNEDVLVLGELVELETVVWGLIKSGKEGLPLNLLRGKWNK